MREAVGLLNGQYDMLPSGVTVLCAVSGGADSMCLLHLLGALSGEWGFSLQCAHFNHRLRGKESDRDEDFVRDMCAKWGIPLTCGGADVAAVCRETGRGTEETARALRYDFLERTARELGAHRIATAHTANDNAETMLFHLVRGAGLQGLCGIMPRHGKVVRPLLTVTRNQVEEYCRTNAIPYVEDSTNADEAYSRNFLRRQVIPLLEQVNPKAVEHMSDAAGRLRGDHDCLSELAQQAAHRAVVTETGVTVDAALLTELPEGVALRAVRLLMERAGGGKNCTAAHLNAVLALCRGKDPSARIDLPGLTVGREYERVIFSPSGEQTTSPVPVPVEMDGKTVYGTWQVTCRSALCSQQSGRDCFYISPGTVRGVLVLRSRQTGDGIKLPGRDRKSLKKLLIDEKIPAAKRDLIPVLADEAGVLAVAGLGPDATRLAKVGEEAIEITFQKE